MARRIRYGIVGDGKVARHFCRYFALLDLPFAHWSRKISAKTGKPLEDLLSGCEVFLILISDAAIEPFIREHPSLSDKYLVHMSGSLVTDLAWGAHPLMTFTPQLYPAKIYEEIPFVVETPSPYSWTFSDLFPELPNPWHEIPKEKKSLYHALCVLGGNFTTLLWKKCFEDFEKRLSLPRKVLIPYLEQVVANLKQDHASSLTGPLERGDRETISKNLDALKNDAFEQVYMAFAETVQPHFKFRQRGN